MPGVSWINSDLLAELEGRDVIEQVAGDLYHMFDERPNSPIEWDRYRPGERTHVSEGVVLVPAIVGRGSTL